ncbi:hypothetical protein TH66_00885 [Carbonactinospora thermoautotrophica]|uniref:PPE domain-containing protein n=2 Tax=Carbonactinospora thermoautotrophica TaxID=1469144 RepID=A0A132N6C0_9ACTN|nr:WXG100 family type VII secretion target [Carbonactinospora thermoautotrophica]KWX05654.1 hypothetical protein TH66_00885 [Carbonactinospora thermoautotrophica]
MSKYESLDHDQLWKLVENADPGALHGAGEHWQRVAADLREQIGVLQAEVRALQASGAWQGQAAEQFSQVVDHIVKSTHQVAEDAETAGRALSSAGDALAQAKRMPPPPPDWKVAAAKALKYGAGVAMPPAPGVNVIGGIVGRVIGERELQEMERDRQEAIRLVAAADAEYRQAARQLDPTAEVDWGGPDVEEWKDSGESGSRASVSGHQGSSYSGVSGPGGGGGVAGYGGGRGVHGYGAGDGGLSGRVPAGGGALPGGGPLGSELEGVNPPARFAGPVAGRLAAHGVGRVGWGGPAGRGAATGEWWWGRSRLRGRWRPGRRRGRDRPGRGCGARRRGRQRRRGRGRPGAGRWGRGARVRDLRGTPGRDRGRRWPADRGRWAGGHDGCAWGARRGGG